MSNIKISRLLDVVLHICNSESQLSLRRANQDGYGFKANLTSHCEFEARHFSKIWSQSPFPQSSQPKSKGSRAYPNADSSCCKVIGL